MHEEIFREVKEDSQEKVVLEEDKVESLWIATNATRYLTITLSVLARGRVQAMSLMKKRI